MKQYYKYILIFLEITLLFSLVASFNRLNNSVEDDIEGNSTVIVPPNDSSSDNKQEDSENNSTEGNFPSVDDNSNEDNSSEVVDFTTLSYVAFGDSITYGADYSLSYSQMGEPYPELVSNALGLASFTNKAVSGATFCTNTLDRVCMTDRVLSHTDKADIISVMLGVNDFATSLPLGKFGDTTSATIYGSLYLIAEHLTTTQEDAFIFFMTPYKCKIGTKTYKDKNNAGYVLADVVTAIKVVASEYNIPVLDMFNEGQYELEMYNHGSDGIHPSQEFIREYTAPQIEEFIRQNYSNKR